MSSHWWIVAVGVIAIGIGVYLMIFRVRLGVRQTQRQRTAHPGQRIVPSSATTMVVVGSGFCVMGALTILSVVTARS
ncbi:MAG: hypothetical protein JWN80_270 [Microbacteriaceae bacterium]|nr:hypothetical protein [Microbacteriaceae bacterium]